MSETSENKLNLSERGSLKDHTNKALTLFKYEGGFERLEDRISQAPGALAKKAIEVGSEITGSVPDKIGKPTQFAEEMKKQHKVDRAA